MIHLFTVFSFHGDLLEMQVCGVLGQFPVFVLQGGFLKDDRFVLAVFFLPQVHFVPDAGTVAQIVYTDDQVRPPQQVVYTADGASYASVDGPQHTLVYIHPVEAAQARWDHG